MTTRALTPFPATPPAPSLDGLMSASWPVILGPPRPHDEAWVSREVHRARALLIMAATHHQTVRYGELSPLRSVHWYDRRVLGGVFDLCQLNGEPDLTAILAPAGQPPADPDEAERVFAYWREARSVLQFEQWTGIGSGLTGQASRRMGLLLTGTRRT